MSIAEWDAYIASAPSIAAAQDRIEEAAAASVDFAALLAEQAKRLPR
jgi:hypothetical protein